MSLESRRKMKNINRWYDAISAAYDNTSLNNIIGVILIAAVLFIFYRYILDVKAKPKKVTPVFDKRCEIVMDVLYHNQGFTTSKIYGHVDLEFSELMDIVSDLIELKKIEANISGELSIIPEYKEHNHKSHNNQYPKHKKR